MRITLIVVLHLVLILGCTHKSKKAGKESLKRDSFEAEHIPLVNDSARTIKEYNPYDDVVKGKIVDEVVLDLNNDGLFDTIRLTDPPITPTGGAGLFHKILIHLNGGSMKDFTAKLAWDLLDDRMLIKNKNFIQSKYIFVCRAGFRSIILLFGFGFGGGSKEFTVLVVNKNSITRLLDSNFENPEQLIDYDQDGVLDFIGQRFSSQSVTEDSLNEYGTYAPFTVYTINDSFTLNDKLTKRYNQENYVWVEKEDSERTLVGMPRHGGKYFIKK